MNRFRLISLAAICVAVPALAQMPPPPPPATAPAAVPAAPMPSPAAAQPAAPKALEYEPGLVVRVRPATDDKAGLSSDDVGTFGITKPEFDFDLHKKNGVKFTDFVGYTFEGWLKASIPGKYQLGVELGGDHAQGDDATCWATLKVEGQELLPRDGSPRRTAVKTEPRQWITASLELEPGLYEYSLTTKCVGSWARGDGTRAAGAILVRRPTDAAIRAAREDDFVRLRPDSAPAATGGGVAIHAGKALPQ